MLTFGGASVVKADASQRLDLSRKRDTLMSDLDKLRNNLEMKKGTLPSSNGVVEESTIRKILKYLEERDQLEDQWREKLFDGMQNKLFDGQDGKDGVVTAAKQVQLARTAKTAKMVFQVKTVRTAKTVKMVFQVNRLLKHQRTLKNQIPHHILQKPLRFLTNQKT